MSVEALTSKLFAVLIICVISQHLTSVNKEVYQKISSDRQQSEGSYPVLRGSWLENKPNSRHQVAVFLEPFE